MKPALMLLIALAACGEPAAPVPPAATGNAERVTVKHILIGFKGSVRDKPITRSKQEAHDLAYKILDLVKHGDDFDKLVQRYSDDSPTGIYTIVNDGVSTRPGEFERRPPKGMVTRFGDVGFSLKVGEVGIADYDSKDCPFGWHVIKRLK